MRHLLFMISFNTSVAILSVLCKSVGSPDVHTQRNGPNPKEKISLQDLKDIVKDYAMIKRSL